MKMDFESRFHFEISLPPPIRMNIKRRKSFSAKLFKNGTAFKLSGKNTLRIRQKFTFKEKPAMKVFSDSFDDIDAPREMITYEAEASKHLGVAETNSHSLVPGSVPTILLLSTSSPVPVASLAIPEKNNLTVNSLLSSSIKTDSVSCTKAAEPVILSETVDSYLPNSTSVSVITLNRIRHKSPSTMINCDSNSFGTFNRHSFTLNTNGSPLYSTINKRNMNKTILNGMSNLSHETSSMFHSLCPTPVTNTGSTFLGTNPSCLSLLSSSLHSLQSLESNKAPLANSTPINIWSKEENCNVGGEESRTCRAIINNSQLTTAADRDTTSVFKLQPSVYKDSAAQRVHQITADRSVNSMTSRNKKEFSVLNSKLQNPENKSALHAEREQPSSKCQNNVHQIAEKKAKCHVSKPEVPVKPNRLKNMNKTVPFYLKLTTEEKEINNNTIVVKALETCPPGVKPNETIQKRILLRMSNEKLQAFKADLNKVLVNGCVSDQQCEESKAQVIAETGRNGMTDGKKMQECLLLHSEKLMESAKSAQCRKLPQSSKLSVISKPSRNTKVKDLVATFNRAMKLPDNDANLYHLPKNLGIAAKQQVPAKHEVNGYGKCSSEWNLSISGDADGCRFSSNRSESVSEFINKRTLIESKLPHMFGAATIGPLSFKSET